MTYLEYYEMKLKRLESKYKSCDSVGLRRSLDASRKQILADIEAYKKWLEESK